jgi:hypothetical protein
MSVPATLFSRTARCKQPVNTKYVPREALMFLFPQLGTSMFKKKLPHLAQRAHRRKHVLLDVILGKKKYFSVRRRVGHPPPQIKLIRLETLLT